MALTLRYEREYNGCEIIIERPDGEQVTVLAHANPIHDEAGMLLGAVNVLVDITECKEAVITVRDTAAGIGAEALPHIFEMFTQETRSPDWSPGGLGIGLTLARRIVDMHGSTITAQSAGHKRGSTFTVRLPAPCRPAPAPPLACTEPSSAEAAAPLRVLVVDDNPDIADSLVMLLEMSGYEVLTAHDGPAAIRTAEARRPDVVLLDIGLPGMDGYDAAQAIRAQPWGEGLVLIAFTGWGQQADIERAFDAGFNHHIVKPVDPDALMHLLASLEPAATR